MSAMTTRLCRIPPCPIRGNPEFPTDLDRHPECLDRNGYPQGLRGDDIRLEARIIAVADTVEAMAAHRPYRPALGIRAALDVIRGERGTAYDKAVVDACLELFEKDGYELPQ